MWYQCDPLLYVSQMLVLAAHRKQTRHASAHVSSLSERPGPPMDPLWTPYGPEPARTGQQAHEGGDGGRAYLKPAPGVRRTLAERLRALLQRKRGPKGVSAANPTPTAATRAFGTSGDVFGTSGDEHAGRTDFDDGSVVYVHTV